MALNQRGSMLMMTLIFVGTMAAICFVTVSMTTNASKDRSGQTKAIQADIIVNGIHSALMKQAQCASILGLSSYSGTATSVSQLSIVQGSPIITGQAVAGGLVIRSINVVPISGQVMKTLQDGSRQYFANIQIDFDGGKDWVSRKKQVDIPIRINTDTSNIVSSCADEVFFSEVSDIDRTCLKSALSYTTKTEILGSVYEVYYMIFSKNTKLRYYCVVPVGSASGFVTACFTGKCLWNK